MSIINKINGVREILQFDNSIEIIRKRLAGENEIVYQIGDLEILVDHSAGDANGAREVLTSNMYRRFFPLIDTSHPLNVLDIGANNGGFALLLKYEGIPIRKLVALEFNPATFKRLQTNIENNFDEETLLLNAALCGEPRIVFASPGSTGTSDSIYSETRAEGALEVEGLSLDQVINRGFDDELVDVCKMDVEGSEFEIFSSRSAESIRRIRHLIIEIHHSAATPREPLIGHIEAFGFEESNGDNERKDDLHYVHHFQNRSL